MIPILHLFTAFMELCRREMHAMDDCIVMKNALNAVKYSAFCSNRFDASLHRIYTIPAQNCQLQERCRICFEVTIMLKIFIYIYKY